MDVGGARKLIAEHLGVSQALILDPVHFRDLGADSLDLVSLTMAFEEAYDLHIPDNQAESCTTVGDAIDLLKQRLSRPVLAGAVSDVGRR